MKVPSMNLQVVTELHLTEEKKEEEEDEEHHRRIRTIAANLSTSIMEIQDIITNTNESEDDELDLQPMEFPYAPTQVDASSFLYMQKNTGQWRKLWCELLDGKLSYRTDEGSQTASGVIPVAFCALEQEDEGTLVRSELTRYTSYYWSYINSLDQPHVFWVCSRSRIYLFRAETSAIRDLFLQNMYSHIEKNSDTVELARKAGAIQEMIPYLREQFIFQMEQYNKTNEALQTPGFQEDDFPITSTRKEKSGVLTMETASTTTKWRDYYFVLFEGCLYHYKDSKSTTPTGFISLRRAAITLDAFALSQEEFTFKVRTPLRTLVCRAKHAVALSEWASCLENAVNSFLPNQNKAATRLARKYSLIALKEIDNMVANVYTLRMLLKSTTGMRLFKDFLAETSVKRMCNGSHVDFFQQVESFSKSKTTANAAFDKAKPIWDTFFRNEAKDTHIHVPESIKRKIEDDLMDNKITTNGFSEAFEYIKRKMEVDFRAFQKTKEFKTFKSGVDKTTAANTRTVHPFKDGVIQSFILKVHKNKRSKEIVFGRRANFLTIGRDKSNHLVIEDSRVSRSHARVEYSDKQCEYIDLGSSCGSKLNGKSVLRTRLQSGDVVELGQSTLIFALKKQKKFFNWFGFRKS